MLLSVLSFLRPTSAHIQTRISTASDGTEGLTGSTNAQFSPDGRYVAFTTGNPLVSGDNNDDPDIYLKDLTTGAVTRISTAAGNIQADDSSRNAQFSSDGRFVLFESGATNLVPEDRLGHRDIFLKELSNGAIIRVSVATGDVEANNGSYNAQLSRDGRYVLFESDASNLVANDPDNKESDIFLRDLVTGDVTCLSKAANGDHGSLSSYNARFSPDGRSVVFESNASNLVAGDNNGKADIFLWDVGTRTLERLSIAKDGTQANGDSFNPRFSPDGHAVVFESSATTLGGDINHEGGNTDIFLKDLDTDTVTCISTAKDGTLGNGNSYNARFSPDGRYVVFESDASNLIANDPDNHVTDIFMKDLKTGDVTCLSTAVNGAETNFDSEDAQFSPDGRHVLFQSEAPNLVANDGNGQSDLFLVNLLYKANAAAILDGRFVETTLGVGNASSVSVDWGDDTVTTQTPVAGQLSLHHAYATTGAKGAVVTLVEGALTWNVAHTVDLAAGTIVRNTALADTLTGGQGGDVLTGDAFRNILNGAAGNDRLDGGAGADVLNGGAGDDTYITDGTDLILEAAGGGIDTVVASSSFSLAAFAQVENLTATAGSAGVMLTGNALANTLIGNAGANRLDGGAGGDVMNGGNGDDTYVTDGSDTIVEAAGGGLDTVLASSSFSLAAFAEVENLTAANGAAGVTLTGNALANILTGNAGADRLSGGSGNDRLTGGFGKDNLTGGSGRDVFAFDDRDTSASKSRADTILDFSRRQSDRIDLKAIDANTRKSGDQMFSFIGTKSFSKAGELRVEKTKSATYVYLNTDNDKSAEAVIKIKGALDLQKGWFVL